MNDKELLELAAKAADEIFTVKLSEPFQGNRKGPFIIRRQRWVQWNPLADDGDALRLAAELKMMVCLHTTPAHVYVDMPSRDVVTDACYRRAITRAAAEIGRNM